MVLRLSLPLSAGSVPRSNAHEQLRHRAEERIGEPDLVPSRLMPLAASNGGEVDRAGGPLWVAGPTDCPTGHAFGALHAPADADVRCGALASRPGPHVITDHATQSVGVLQDVEPDSVDVRKLGSRIGRKAGEHSIGIAKPKSHRVQVMDRHDAAGQPSLSLAATASNAGSPACRSWPSTGRPSDGSSINTLSKQRLAGPHRLVVTHVLVDAQRDPRVSHRDSTICFAC